MGSDHVRRYEDLEVTTIMFRSSVKNNVVVFVNESESPQGLKQYTLRPAVSFQGRDRKFQTKQYYSVQESYALLEVLQRAQRWIAQRAGLVKLIQLAKSEAVEDLELGDVEAFNPLDAQRDKI